MEIVEIQVTGKKSLTLPWEEIQVMPIGDVQVGAEEVMEDKLRRHVEWGMMQGNTYFIGMGDYIDVMSPSNRGVWRAAKLYDSARKMMAEKAEECTKRFLKIVKGTEGRWLGLLEGHHYFEFEDGTTSDTRIASALGASYLGTCAFVRLSFVKNKANGDRKTSMKCVIWTHHGAGNGIMPHSPLNKLYHVMHSFDADVYLMGHQTKKPVVKMPRIYMSDVPPYRLVARNKVMAGTGGWMAAYSQGSKHYSGTRPQGSYVEQALLSPSALGGVIVRIRPVWGTKGTGRIDLNVEV